MKGIMEPIKINVQTIKEEIKTSKPVFEVEPLDVNIAKIQFELTKRLEREMPEYGDFAPVIEKYENKGTYYKFSEIGVKCSHAVEDASKKLRSLDLIIKSRESGQEYVCNLIKGTKEEILAFLNPQSCKKYFEICKNIALNHIK